MICSSPGSAFIVAAMEVLIFSIVTGSLASVSRMMCSNCWIFDHV